MTQEGFWFFIGLLFAVFGLIQLKTHPKTYPNGQEVDWMNALPGIYFFVIAAFSWFITLILTVINFTQSLPSIFQVLGS